MTFKKKQIRHIRILDLRSKINKGWNLEELEVFCVKNLGVTRHTAISYIDEAAEPYRKKFEEEKK